METFPRNQLAAVGNVLPPWSVDGDGWVTRPVRPGDPPRQAFSHSCHAFIEGGRLYCRNADQAALLDRGIVPDDPQPKRSQK